MRTTARVAFAALCVLAIAAAFPMWGSGEYSPDCPTNCAGTTVWCLEDVDCFQAICDIVVQGGNQYTYKVWDGTLNGYTGADCHYITQPPGAGTTWVYGMCYTWCYTVLV
jgi:hypothetical protein